MDNIRASATNGMSVREAALSSYHQDVELFSPKYLAQFEFCPNFSSVTI